MIPLHKPHVQACPSSTRGCEHDLLPLAANSPPGSTILDHLPTIIRIHSFSNSEFLLPEGSK